jgi:hypothetical protein
MANSVVLKFGRRRRRGAEDLVEKEKEGALDPDLTLGALGGDRRL